MWPHVPDSSRLRGIFLDVASIPALTQGLLPSHVTVERGPSPKGRLSLPPLSNAYDQHALKAFEVNALDYLLKPIAASRLAAAIQKVRSGRNLSREQIFLREG